MYLRVFHLANPQANQRLAAALLLVSALVCAAFSFATGISQAEEPAATQAGSVIAPEQPKQIVQWVTQLDDDRFDTRQRAQQQLEQAGQAALEAVAAIAQTGSLESSTRAINILLKWSESPQQDLRLAALEKLANLPDRPRESAMAARLLADAREAAAIEALTRLGARVERDQQIRSIANLQVVIGPQWQGGNAGLQHLADVPSATTVSLHAAPLGDSAVDYLGKLSQVRRIELYGTKFSPEALAKLRQQLPRTEVVERGGAKLGIGGNVQSVVPNSAAAKAGIKPGDRITEFNGEKVANFEALTERIAKQQPGDTVTLTVLRNNQSREVQVTFDQWGSNVKREVNPQVLVPMPLPPGFQPKIVIPAKRR